MFTTTSKIILFRQSINDLSGELNLKANWKSATKA